MGGRQCTALGCQLSQACGGFCTSASVCNQNFESRANQNGAAKHLSGLFLSVYLQCPGCENSMAPAGCLLCTKADPSNPPIGLPCALGCPQSMGCTSVQGDGCNACTERILVAKLQKRAQIRNVPERTGAPPWVPSSSG